jgi:exoribonuclease II
MIGTGKHWKPRLTVPEAPHFDLKDNFGLEKVKCITKPVIRNGEIVRDAQVYISRYNYNPQSELTNALAKHENADQIHERNLKDHQ